MHNASNLIWVDMEMTGLDPDRDFVLEIATIVTDTCVSGAVGAGGRLTDVR